MPYQYTSAVRYSEAGEDRKLTIPGLVNYFQDCSTFQSEELGNSIDTMKQLGKVWVLAGWQIEIRALPALGDRVLTETWPTSFQGFQGQRNYRMLDEQGNDIAYANSLWIYVDLNTGHPARIDREVRDAYTPEPALEMGKMDRKIILPEEGEWLPSFAVRKRDLDTNHHVNNASYIAYACEYLRAPEKVEGLRVEYRSAAYYGDQIVPFTAEQNGRLTVGLCDEGKKPDAIVEFRMKE